MSRDGRADAFVDRCIHSHLARVVNAQALGDPHHLIWRSVIFENDQEAGANLGVFVFIDLTPRFVVIDRLTNLDGLVAMKFAVRSENFLCSRRANVRLDVRCGMGTARTVS